MRPNSLLQTPRWGLLSAALLAACLLAAPAADANYMAIGGDREGDAADPNPGPDITVAALGYDCKTGTHPGRCGAARRADRGLARVRVGLRERAHAGRL